MLKRSALACIVLLACTSSAFATERPTELNGYIRTNSPYGSGQVHHFLIHVYDADLWTDATHWSWHKLFALTLHYHLGISRSDLCNASIKKMNDLLPLPDSQSRAIAEQLNKIFPDVKSGDRITALYTPNRETRFYYNGKFQGKIANSQIARQFLSIWLDEKTSEPGLRQSLLASSTHEAKDIQ